MSEKSVQREVQRVRKRKLEQNVHVNNRQHEIIKRLNLNNYKLKETFTLYNLAQTFSQQIYYIKKEGSRVFWEWVGYVKIS